MFVYLLNPCCFEHKMICNIKPAIYHILKQIYINYDFKFLYGTLNPLLEKTP